LSPGFPEGESIRSTPDDCPGLHHRKEDDYVDAMLKSVETRFESQVSMTERVLQQVFKSLVQDALFLEWFVNQPNVIRLEVHDLVCNTL
jgi:hypothetical protein